jgi:carbon monoxide dehydrogenase subunit G
MRMSGQRGLPVAPQAARDAPIDPESLEACMPGAVVRPAPVEAGTRLDYDVAPRIGGQLPQTGSRPVDGAARRAGSRTRSSGTSRRCCGNGRPRSRRRSSPMVYLLAR